MDFSFSLGLLYYLLFFWAACQDYCQERVSWALQGSLFLTQLCWQSAQGKRLFWSFLLFVALRYLLLLFLTLLLERKAKRFLMGGADWALLSIASLSGQSMLWHLGLASLLSLPVFLFFKLQAQARSSLPFVPFLFVAALLLFFLKP